MKQHKYYFGSRNREKCQNYNWLEKILPQVLLSVQSNTYSRKNMYNTNSTKGPSLPMEVMSNETVVTFPLHTPKPPTLIPEQQNNGVPLTIHLYVQ